MRPWIFISFPFTSIGFFIVYEGNGPFSVYIRKRGFVRKLRVLQRYNGRLISVLIKTENTYDLIIRHESLSERHERTTEVVLA